MPKKAYKKKKAHQRFCHQQALKGLINDEEGKWVRSTTPASRGLSLLAGYRVK